jgi:hypothetical protein
MQQSVSSQFSRAKIVYSTVVVASCLQHPLSRRGPTLRRRYGPMNVFDHIPALDLETDAVLTHLDTLLDNHVLFQAVKEDLSRRFPRTSSFGRPSTPVEVVQRLLKPRTPDDCPVCRQQTALPTPKAATPLPVMPCCELKSRRRALGRIATQGFACPNRTCAYYQISDAQVHALLADRTHAKHQRFQSLRCQACTTTFRARRDPPL